MRNQTLCENLWKRGQEIYYKYRESFLSDEKIVFDRPEIDEEYYAQMPLYELKKLAESGNSDAQFCYGNYLAENGNMAEAITWFERSANNGNAEAMDQLGGIYLWGVDSWPRDSSKAYYWLKRASETACSAFTTELMVSYYLDSDLNGEPQYSDFVKALPWMILYSEFMSESDEARDSAERVILCINAISAMDLDDLYNKPESRTAQNIQIFEDLTLLCYQWLSIAQEHGTPPNAPNIPRAHELLCRIGEAASWMNRAYAKGTLIEAMDAGSDYAAVLLVPAEIDGAIDTRTTPSGYMITDNFIIPSIGPKQAKAADARVKPYFSHVKRAAEDTTWEFRQSEALYRLSHFYLFGLCCNRNINAAHDCMERAADLGHSSAQKFLPRFHKKFLGGWEFDFT